MRRWRRAVIVAAAASIAVGATWRTTSAAPTERPRPKAQQPSEETPKEGTLAVVRGLRGPEAQLTERSGTRWLVVGPLQQELLRLGGHTVKVWAAVGEQKVVLPTLTVRRYEILDAGGGRKPLVGVLRLTQRKELELRHEDDTAVKVLASKALLDQLKRRVGCRVWIAGELSGDALNAHKFGWLSCAKPGPLKSQKETSK